MQYAPWYWQPYLGTAEQIVEKFTASNISKMRDKQKVVFQRAKHLMTLLS